MPIRWYLPVILVLFVAGPQVSAAEPDNGFSTAIRPNFAGEEIRAQDHLWGLEIVLKPMRMVYVQVPNAKTGAKSSELVWYLVYKVVNRPVPRAAEAADSVPVNVEDPQVPPVFVPQATLITEDRNSAA